MKASLDMESQEKNKTVLREHILDYLAYASLQVSGFWFGGELWLFSPNFERWKFTTILSSTYPIATALYTTEVARARRHSTGAL